MLPVHTYLLFTGENVPKLDSTFYKLLPPLSWINFIQNTNMVHTVSGIYDIIQHLKEYDAAILPLPFDASKTTYIIFNTNEGYLDFVLRYGLDNDI